MNIEKIAMVAHETNRAFCHSIGDSSQPKWGDAPQWQRDSAVNGVKYHLENPKAKPSDSHDNWLKEKTEAGWIYGEIKDAEKKTHPCCVPYDDLPIEQQIKDMLFISVVHAMKPLLEKI